MFYSTFCTKNIQNAFQFLGVLGKCLGGFCAWLKFQRFDPWLQLDHSEMWRHSTNRWPRGPVFVSPKTEFQYFAFQMFIYLRCYVSEDFKRILLWLHGNNSFRVKVGTCVILTLKKFIWSCCLQTRKRLWSQTPVLLPNKMKHMAKGGKFFLVTSVKRLFPGLISC